MKRSFTLVLAAGMAVIALATGGMMGAFNKTYKIKPDSALGKAKCMICHKSKSGGTLNPYGAALKALDGKKVGEATFKKVEGQDSDGDGIKNGDEIRKDRNPGIKG